MFLECVPVGEFLVSLSVCSVNANLDLIVSATPLLEALGLSPGETADHTHLVSIEGLQEQVGYSMLHCAGTERVFTSKTEFQRVVTAAYQLPHTVSPCSHTYKHMYVPYTYSCKLSRIG